MIKDKIYSKAKELRVNLVRTCDAEQWERLPVQPPEFWPQNIWPWSKKVICLGIPLFAPMIDSTPSMVYQELYDTSNRILDDISYHLTNYIVNTLGYKAVWFPRDCYYSIDVLLDNPNAAFSHVIAAYYAGMGTIGDSHNLITKEFGPRVRIVSIITDAPIDSDPMLKGDLCLHCGKCLKACPSKCFTNPGPDKIYTMDKIACTAYNAEVKNQHHWPCGMCIDVCPVGEDLKTYKGTDRVTSSGITHLQSFGL